MTESQKWMSLSVVLLAGFLFYLLSPILSPFLIAALIGYCGDPLVDRLEKHKLSRTISVSIVFSGFSILVLALLFLLVPLLERQLLALLYKLPGFIDFIQTQIIPKILDFTGLEDKNSEHGFDYVAVKQTIRDNWWSISDFASHIVNTISKSGLSIIVWVSNIILIPVIAFYFMRDWDQLVNKTLHLLPRHIEPLVKKLAKQSDEVLGAFIRGQMVVMASLAGIYSIGLWIAGLELALLVGLLAGLVSFVPYLGFIVGILAAIVASLIQFHDLSLLIPIAIVFSIGQLLESLLLTPLLVGGKIGLHPVAVIFSIMAGGQLFGFVGILIALPVSAVIMVLLRYFYQSYVASSLYGREQVQEENT